MCCPGLLAHFSNILYIKINARLAKATNVYLEVALSFQYYRDTLTMLRQFHALFC